MIQPPPKFTGTPDSIAADAQRLVEHSRRLRDELAHNIVPSTATFANVMLPLAHMESDFDLQAKILNFYRDVSADEQIRDASQKAQRLFDDFHTESWLREDIFSLVNAVRENGEDLDEESSLFLKRVYGKHIQTGVGIRDAGQRQRFKEIQARLGEIKVALGENLGQDESSICFAPAELEGVSESILSRIERNEEGDQYKATLSNSGHTEILSYAANAAIRKSLFIACQKRCSENAPLLKEAVSLRHESALLLGFPNHAAFQLDDKMVKAPETVNEFLEDVRAKLMPRGLDAVQTLKDLKKADLARRGEADQHDGRFFLWDYDFYHRLMLEQQLSIDKKTIMEYFPTQTTILGMLELFAHLFALEFTELEGSDKSVEVVWHEDVQVFSVHDDQARGGSFLDYLYLDLYHRAGKSPIATCFNLQPVSIDFTLIRSTSCPNILRFLSQRPPHQYTATIRSTTELGAF